MHTNQTSNYQLPQWIGTDSPAWLGDMNPAFATIDSNIKSANVTATSANNTSSRLSTRLTSDETLIGNNSTAIANLDTRVTTAEGKVANIETLDGNTSLSGIGDGTITNAIKVTNTSVVSGAGNGEVVNLVANNWNASSLDSRYPLAQTIAVVNSFTAPNFALYVAGGLSSANQDSTFATVPKCVYDSSAKTVTFYSTATDKTSLVDIAVRLVG